MSAGAQQRDPASGSFKRSVDHGSLLRNTADNTGCCCGCKGCWNAHAALTITLDGIVLPGAGTCLECVQGDFTFWFNFDSVVAHNGTYTLDVHESGCPCIWELEFPVPDFATFIRKYDNEAACDAPDTTGSGYILKFSAVLDDAGNLRVRVFIDSFPSLGWPYVAGGFTVIRSGVKIFDATFPWDCATETTVANELTAFDCGDPSVGFQFCASGGPYDAPDAVTFGYGGTVTVSV